MNCKEKNKEIHKDTNTQIHNYTYTKIHKFTDTQIHSYTNTQIHKLPVAKRPMNNYQSPNFAANWEC